MRILLVMAIMSALLIIGGCQSEPAQKIPAETASEPEEAGVPLVTLKHWKDSTPGERYSFLIGFVTMLELEKEWQGRDGRELLPFDRSLISGWLRGFENRPLSEIYNGLNRYIAEHPGELDRPAAEVMWFLFAQPRMPAGGTEDAGGAPSGSDAPEGSD